MRLVVSPILLAAALICAIFAVLVMTVWKPSPLVSASATVPTRYAVTDPGVMGLVNRSVGAELASESGKPVCLAVATSQDAAGWVSGRSYTRITGLESWTRLAARPDTATSVTHSGGSVAFKNSDLWHSVSCGRSVRLQPTASASSPLVLIADTNPHASAALTAGHAARLTLTWQRTHVSDAAQPLWLSAGLLALAAVLCFSIFSLSQRRRRKDRRLVEKEAKEHADQDPALVAEREQRNIAGDDAPRWANDHLRSRRQRESRHRHAGHRGFLATIRDLSRKADSASASSASGPDADSGTTPASSPSIHEIGQANMVARLQETQTMAPISAPIRGEGIGEEIDNGEGRPPSYTPPSSEEIREYLRRLQQEKLGAQDDPADSKNDSPVAGSPSHDQSPVDPRDSLRDSEDPHDDGTKSAEEDE